MRAFLDFDHADPEHSKVFNNADFGYYKVVVERPLRLAGVPGHKQGRAYLAAEIRALKESHERDDEAEPIIKRIHRTGTRPDPLHGLFEATIDGKRRVVEYEPDTDLRDTEQIPLTEPANGHPDGITAFITREVLPYVPDAWVDESKTKIGYEISFTRHFYKPTPLRTLDEIRADIRALQEETEDLLADIVGVEA